MPDEWTNPMTIPVLVVTALLAIGWIVRKLLSKGERDA